jgi:hypothetical protein
MALPTATSFTNELAKKAALLLINLKGDTLKSRGDAMVLFGYVDTG